MGHTSRMHVWRRPWIPGLLLLAGLAACGESENDMVGPPADDPPGLDEEGTWQTRAGLPDALVGTAATYWNGFVYAVGGYAGTEEGDATPHVLRIQAATLDVERLADFPTTIAEAALAVYRDTLFLLGGNEGDHLDIVPSSTIYSYDESTDAWTPWGNLPDARYQLTAHAAGDKLYVIGGRALFEPPGDSIVVVDGGAVAYGEPPNRDLVNPVVGGVISDTIFAMGSLFQSTMVRYDADAEAWADGLGSPFEGQATGGVFLGRFHGFGNRQTPEHLIWDSAELRWRSATPPPAPVSRAAVVEADGRLLLIGGSDRQRVNTNRIQAYDPPS